MADRPILFSAPMIRALLSGRKTQTRRILKPQPNGDVIHYGWQAEGGAFWTDQHFESHRLPIWAGDRLWVREAWRTEVRYDNLAPSQLPRSAPIYYAADPNPRDSEPGCAGRLRASMHMPRWASRLTLTVTDVRVQRLQEVSEEDARAEGAGLDEALLAAGLKATYRGGFARIWAGIHEPHPNNPTSWSNNPWVAAYSFTVEHRNIDAALSRASGEAVDG